MRSEKRETLFKSVWCINLNRVGRWMEISRKKTQIVFEAVAHVIQYQLPNVQRLLNSDHVDHLVRDQIEEMSSHGEFSMLQSITCADLDEKRYVLDGQHRIEAFKILKSQGYQLDFNIPVICYSVSSFDELQKYYLRINKHNPINPLEVSNDWVKYGKQFCTWFLGEYKTYMKQGEAKCNCPNINLDEMMSYIKRYNVFSRIPDDMDILDFINQIKKLNAYMNENSVQIANAQIQSDFTNRISKCIKKNPLSPCILGIWRRFEWLEIILYSLANKTRIEDITFSKFALVRPKIGKQKRIDVWKKRNGVNMNGVCYVCDEDMTFENMECGHIIPFFHGGGCEQTNLEPICKTCNRDMGILNLTDYKSIMYKK